jgi:hypothetical protein
VGGSDAHDEQRHEPFIPEESRSPAPDEAFLPTEISPHIAGNVSAEQGGELDDNMSVGVALARVDEARVRRDDFRQEENILTGRIARLKARRRAAAQGIVNAESLINDVLPKSRIALWRQVGERPVVNSLLLADAVRLSPYNDEPESPVEREARVHAIAGMDRRIRRHTPTVIAYTHSAAENYAVTYYAGMPAHNGFSFRMDPASGSRSAFVAGINQDTSIPLALMVSASGSFQPNGALPQVEVMPLVTIHTGEAAATFLNGECASSIAEISAVNDRINGFGRDVKWTPEAAEVNALDRQYRDHVLKRTVEAFTAARAIGSPIELPDRTLAGDTLRDYMFELGDTNSKISDITKVGMAIHDIFSGDNTAMIDYLVQSSRARRREYSTRHYTWPVVSVLQQVCGADQADVIRRLLYPK